MKNLVWMLWLGWLAFTMGIQCSNGDIRLPAIFGDHMILQQGRPVRILGWAEPGEPVTATVCGQTKRTVTSNQGRWEVVIDPLQSGEAVEMTVAGRNSITIRDILIGEVWVCSGQSNMEWPVKESLRAEQEIADASHPEIRLFTVTLNPAQQLQSDCEGRWQVCTPETVADFSAVAYFFGRELHRARGIPIGLIHASRGGTPVEAWMPREALETNTAARPLMEHIEKLTQDWDSGAALERYKEAWARWKKLTAPTAKTGGAPEADGHSRRAVFVEHGAPSLVGIVGVPWREGDEWIEGGGKGNYLYAGRLLGAGDVQIKARLRVFDVAGSAASFLLRESHFGFADPKQGRLFARGPLFGDKTLFLSKSEDFFQPGVFFQFEVVRTGPNLVVRIDGRPAFEGPCDAGAIGRFGFRPWLSRMQVSKFEARGAMEPFPPDLAQECKPKRPSDPRLSRLYPSLHYNGMIAPVIPFPIRGVIWYQGEKNRHRAYQYRALFPALIESWRAAWGSGDFPFLFVQLANLGEAPAEPGDSEWAELREAQAMALRLPRTGMAVAIDIGEADNVHARNKQEVGARLALAAHAVAYGENLVYSGPLYESMKVEEGRVRLTFTHVGTGLVARGADRLRGFAIAGADRRFVWADAAIDGDTVVVSSSRVQRPVAVRYAWADNPDGCNLYNKEGLPASPFRTDDWPGVTAQNTVW